jgi:hypothetical protein
MGDNNIVLQVFIHEAYRYGTRTRNANAVRRKCPRSRKAPIPVPCKCDKKIYACDTSAEGDRNPLTPTFLPHLSVTLRRSIGHSQ